MRDYYTCLLILIGLTLPMQAQAQKAYDILAYRADMYGNQAKLELADGYLLASKITMLNV